MFRCSNGSLKPGSCRSANPVFAPAQSFRLNWENRSLSLGGKSTLADRPTDPDSILRIAYLVWALGRRDALMKFIQAAAETLWDAAGSRMQAANEDRYLDLLNVGFLLGRPPYEISWLAEVGFIPAHALRHEGRRIGSSGSVRCGRGPRRSALSRPFNRRNLLNRQLKPTCAKLGLEGVTWHWLRHANATLLDAVGTPLGTMQDLLGHSSAAVTREIYLHCLQRPARRYKGWRLC